MKRLVSLVSVVIFVCLCSSFFVFSESPLVNNPSFEESTSGSPSFWTFDSYTKDSSYSKSSVVTGTAHSGKSFVTIENFKQNDSRFKQNINVKPNTTYKLSCWIKTENVGSVQNGRGASISIEGKHEASKDLKGTNNNWQQVEMYVNTNSQTSFTVTVGIGGYGADDTGKASFDDVTIEEVTSVPEGAIIASLDNQTVANNNNSTQNNSPTSQISGPGSTFWIILILGALIFIGGVVYYLLILSKKSTSDENTSETEENENDIELINNNILTSDNNETDLDDYKNSDDYVDSADNENIIEIEALENENKETLDDKKNDKIQTNEDLL